jgi:hypothetical protein
MLTVTFMMLISLEWTKKMPNYRKAVGMAL